MEFDKSAVGKFISNNQNIREKLNVEKILESMGNLFLKFEHSINFIINLFYLKDTIKFTIL